MKNKGKVIFSIGFFISIMKLSYILWNLFFLQVFQTNILYVEKSIYTIWLVRKLSIYQSLKNHISVQEWTVEKSEDV